MRLILIGWDHEVEDALLSANLPNNSQITAYGAPDPLNHLQRWVDQIRPREAWMSALNETGILAFVVAGDPPPIEQLRFLTQSGQSILVTHPACSMIEGFELQMIQADTQAAIQPLFRGINHPLLDVLCQWQSDPTTSPIGPIKQFAIRRPLPDVSRAAVIKAFARDALLLRRLLAKVDRVNAIGVESLEQADWSHLSAQMMGQPGPSGNSPVGRWTTVPATAGASACLDIVGELGSAQARLEDDPAAWTLRQTTPATAEIALPPWGGSSELLARFQGDQPNPLTTRDWEHACRALELADAVEQSCRRGKTISIYHEQHTEEATFKSMMAAGGCLLLMAMLMFLVMLQAVQTMRPGIAEWSGWWVVWRGVVVVFFGFLSLQLLRLLFRRPDQDA